MRKNINWIWAAILTYGIMTLTSCADNIDNPGTVPDTPTPTVTEAEYTVMLYTVGGGDLDNDIERDILRAAQAMEKPDERVRYMVQYKYSDYINYIKKRSSMIDISTLYPRSGEPGSVYRYELSYDTGNYEANDTTNQVKRLHLTDDMLYGNQQIKAEFFQPDSIASFIKYCQKTAPAKNYILILSDHGGGYTPQADYDKSLMPASPSTTRGTLYDDYFDDKALSVHELRQGIERSGVKLKLLDFDCCLMNQMEVLSEFVGLADYVLASGHTTFGENHAQLVKLLRKASDTGDFIGSMKEFVDANCLYSADIFRNSGVSAAKDVDYVLTDMSKFPAVLTALREFTDYIVNNYDRVPEDPDLGFDQPAQDCYQYIEFRPFYDLYDYCYMLALNVFANNGMTFEIVPLMNSLKDAIAQAQVYHNYAFNSLDKATYTALSYSVNLGSKGFLAWQQDALNPWFLTGYNNLGEKVMFDTRTGEQTTTGEAVTAWAWSNSYQTTAFDRETGWSRWLMLNPGQPMDNPPISKFYDNIRESEIHEAEDKKQAEDTGERMKFNFSFDCNKEVLKTFNIMVRANSSDKGTVYSKHKLYSNNLGGGVEFMSEIPEKVQLIIEFEKKANAEDGAWKLVRNASLEFLHYNNKEPDKVLHNNTFKVPTVNLSGDHLATESEDAAKKAYVNVVATIDKDGNVSFQEYSADNPVIITADSK